MTEFPMLPETLEALEASITEWERKRAMMIPASITIGSTFCPLCVLFSEQECLGCPIAQAGYDECIRSPYLIANIALWAWKSNPSSAGSRRQWEDAAQAEIDFLKSLLPPLMRDKP